MTYGIQMLAALMHKYPALKSAFHKAINRANEKLSGEAPFALSHSSNIEISSAIDNEFYSGRITPDEWKIVLHYQRLVVRKIRGSSI